MREDFILKIDFEKNGTFVYIGGLRVLNFDSMKTPVETEDLSDDKQFFLEESGVHSVQIEGTRYHNPRTSS